MSIIIKVIYVLQGIITDPKGNEVGATLRV
jgi:hypothetical protein